MNKLNLHQWLDYISATHPQDIEMGLDRVKQVFSALDLSTEACKVVLVAGTNGKGSTIAMIESVLLAAGLQVGAYTSPHILEYNERVRINGQPITDALLTDSFERVERVRGTTPLTYFEFGTLAAFDLLIKAELDVLLLEIGLGGRLDAVNIVEPDLSIITSIGLDHTEWLGDTLDKIGLEKAGILRPGVPLIAGEAMPASVLERAASLNCPLYLCRQTFDKRDNTAGRFLVSGQPRNFDGLPQARLPENNILLAIQASICLLEQLEGPEFGFDQARYRSMVDAISAVSIPGRLERAATRQEVYIDVGHNPHAAVYLKAFLMHHAQQNKRVQLVYSSLKDKDVSQVAEVLASCADRWLLAPLENARAMSLDSLCASVKQQVDSEVQTYPSVAAALDAALGLADEAEKNGQSVLTLVFGSFYMVEAAKRFFIAHG